MKNQATRGFRRASALAALAALGIATALLAACGGGNNNAPLPAAPTATLTINGSTSPFVNTLYNYEAVVTGATATGLSWAWGDGSTNSLGATVKKVWAKAGIFTASLTGTASGVTLTGNKTGSASAVPVAPSYDHTCYLMPDTSVTCKGSNNNGQLGNGTLNASVTPVAVSGLTGVKAISVGYRHSCALKTDGTVACWGRNLSGELGNGTGVSSSVPVAVTSVTGAVTVGSGQNHNCVIKTDATMLCWGNNLLGQLGNGDSSGTNRLTPVAVTGLTNAVQVMAGDNHTCVLKGDASVVCFGNNSNGQLGNNSLQNSALPVVASNLTGVAVVGASYNHSCALKTDGTVWCWGWNFFGQLGDGSNVDKSVPTAVAGLTGVVALNATGTFSNCALKSDASVACWGYNTTGGLGDGTNTHRNTPVAVTVTGVASVLAIAGHHGQTTCAVKAANEQICWGTPSNN